MKENYSMFFKNEKGYYEFFGSFNSLNEAIQLAKKKIKLYSKIKIYKTSEVAVITPMKIEYL